MPEDHLLARLQSASGDEWAIYDRRALALHPIEGWRAPFFISPVPRLVAMLQAVWPAPPRDYHPELWRAMQVGQDANIAGHEAKAGEAARLAAGLAVMSEHLAWAIGTKNPELGEFAGSIYPALRNVFL